MESNWLREFSVFPLHPLGIFDTEGVKGTGTK